MRVPRAITPLDYAAAYNAYAQGLAQLAPGVPLFAPAVAYPSTGLRFSQTLLAGPHPGLRVVTGHDYPYSACVPRHSRYYPTIGRLLSEQATAGMARSVRPMLKLARAAGLNVRLTEINSVTCGGLPGVSNTFATALWAPDALFDLMRAGVAAVNLHARVFAVNDPFTFDAHGLQIHPLLYGLILFIRMLGPHAQLASLQPSHGASHFKAWVVRIAGGELHVLLLDKGSQPLRIRLALPATSPAHLERMLAPSVTSREGETLAGQSLDHDGRWSGSYKTELVNPDAGHYVVRSSPYSATLLSVPIAGPFT